MDIYSQIIMALRSLLGPMAFKPYAVVTVLIMGILIQLLAILAYRKLTDVEKLTRYQREITSWRESYLRALKTGDKKALERLERKKRRINQLQMEVFKSSMRIWLLMFAPFLLLWNIFKDVIGTNQVAYLPLLNIWLDFNTWYILSVFSISFISQRILGIRTRG